MIVLGGQGFAVSTEKHGGVQWERLGADALEGNRFLTGGNVIRRDQPGIKTVARPRKELPRAGLSSGVLPSGLMPRNLPSTLMPTLWNSKGAFILCTALLPVARS